MNAGRSLWLACIVLLAVPGIQFADEQRPNFVWLVSEDNSKHYLKLFDQHGVETPHIASLAVDGLIFKHAFSNSPVCSVARTTLMTGCYAPRILTQYHRKTKPAPLLDGVEMFPAILRQAGYYTTNRSKKDYNAVEGNGVWDESSKKATWRNRGTDQPFFHMQSFAQSHEGSLHFDNRQFEQELTATDPKTVFVAPYHPQTDLFRYTNARYRDRIRAVDKEIGKVIQRLKDDGLYENTVVFYFGDHGGVLPRSKGYLYESGLHVPLIVRVPENFRHLVEFDSDGRVNGFVNFVDFGPTVLHLAGIKQYSAVDGKPFLGGAVTLDELNSRNTAFGYADRFDEKYDLVRSLRKGRYKYIRNYEPFNFDGLHNNYRYRMLAYRQWRELFQAGKLNDVQRQFFLPKKPEAIYDLAQDPHETVNLADKPELAETLEQLRKELTKRLKSMPDLSFFPESYLLEEALENPTGFGQRHQAQIGSLIDIANLALNEFEFESHILSVLESGDPWKRYWALIACSTYGTSARKYAERIAQIANSDPEPLVRARAAEYLAISRIANPAPIIEKALQASKSRTEQNLILNSVVMLRDGYDCKFNIQREWFELKNNKDNVERRLSYLLND